MLAGNPIRGFMLTNNTSPPRGVVDGTQEIADPMRLTHIFCQAIFTPGTVDHGAPASLGLGYDGDAGDIEFFDDRSEAPEALCQVLLILNMVSEVHAFSDRVETAHARTHKMGAGLPHKHNGSMAG